MKDAVTVALEHLGMRVEARVSEFGDLQEMLEADVDGRETYLFGQQLDSIGTIAENNRLIDLKLERNVSIGAWQSSYTDLAKESIQTMDLLLLLDVCIILSDTP